MSTLESLYKDQIKKKYVDSNTFSNVMEIPKIEKIILSRGIGESIKNSKSIDSTIQFFLDITGQKPVLCKAKKSISNFSLREGQIIGAKVTLRGKKMYDFFTKLVNIVIPKIRDFRGLPINSFDGDGNYSFGIKDDSIFPDCSKDFDKNRGLNITIVTNTSSDKNALDLLNHFSFPFRKR